MSERPLAFSYSKLSLFEECPLKFRFKYLDKLPEMPKSYFAFGSSIHTALEFLYGVRALPFPTLRETLEAFRKDWDATTWAAKGYRQERWAAMDYEKGVHMLTAYYEHNKERFRPPFSVEYATDVLVDGLKVRIICDRIEHHGGGLIDIIDYKTGKDVKRVPDQLHMYQKISEADPQLKERLAEFSGRPVSEVRIGRLLYYHVPTLKEYEFPRAGDREIGEFWERVLGVAAKVRSGMEKYDALADKTAALPEFAPTPSERACNWCDFKLSCPLFTDQLPPEQPGLGLPERPAQAPAAAPADAGLARLADLYGRALRKRDAAAADLRELAEQLKAAAPAGGAEIEGDEFRLSVRRAPAITRKNREAVIAALKKHGLLESVLSPDAINQLLNPDSELSKRTGVSAEARAELLALAEETAEVKARPKV